MKRSLGCVMLLCGFMLFGCSSWTVMKDVPALSQEVQACSSLSEKPAAVLKCTGSLNGYQLEPNPTFVRQFVERLESSKVFSRVSQSEAGFSECVELELQVDQQVDSHPGSSMLKGFIIGASLFTLTPVIPLRADLDCNMNLVATRPDGQAKSYAARSSGFTRFHLFADPAIAGNDLATKVIDSGRNSIVNQIVRDAEFYLSN